MMGAVFNGANSDYTYGDILTNNSNYFHNIEGENSMWAMPVSSNIPLMVDHDHGELQRRGNILQAMDMFDEYAERGNSRCVLEEEEGQKDEFSYINNDRYDQCMSINKENSYITINDGDEHAATSSNLIIDGVINTLFSDPLSELHDSDELCAARHDLIGSRTLLDAENLLILPEPFINFDTDPDHQSTTSSSDQESNPCFSSSYGASSLMTSLDFLSHVQGASDHSPMRCRSFNSRSAACSSNSLQEFDDQPCRSACDHSQLNPCNSMQPACDHPQSACAHSQLEQAACDHPQLNPCNSLQEFDDHKVLLHHRESPVEAAANMPCSPAPHHRLDHYSTLCSINGGAATTMGKSSGLLSTHGAVHDESLNNIHGANRSDHRIVSDHAGYESVCDHGSYTSVSNHSKIDGIRDNYNILCDEGHDVMYDQGHDMVCDHASYPKQMKMMQREAVYAAAALQPVDWASILAISAGTRPKRRNVRISHDPQTVSARRRRERISDRIRVLQRLVPGGTSMDTASMLDEAIHYLKFLKSQVQALEWLERGSSAFPLLPSSSSSCFYPNNFTSTSLPKLIK